MAKQKNKEPKLKLKIGNIYEIVYVTGEASELYKYIGKFGGNYSFQAIKPLNPYKDGCNAAELWYFDSIKEAEHLNELN